MADWIRRLAIIVSAACLATWAAAGPLDASSARVSAGSRQRAPSEVEADYTTPRVLISEAAHDHDLLYPQVTGVETAEHSLT